MSDSVRLQADEVALIDEDDPFIIDKESEFQRSSKDSSTIKAHMNDLNNTNANPNNGILPLRINVSTSAGCCETNGDQVPSSYTYRTIDDIQHHLSALQDENSPYMNVSKACHFLNQFCSHGSYNAFPSTSSSSSLSLSSPKIIQSTIIQIQTYTKDISQIIQTLSNTSTSHTDRRCRIIALQTLCTISIQTLPKIYSKTHNPHLYSNREDIQYLTRIEDEICNDVILNIVNHCILDDDDDGVVAVGMECLGKFVVNDCWGHDDLSKEVCDIRGSMMSKANHLVPRRGLWDGYFDKTCSLSKNQMCSVGSSYVDHIQDVDCKIHRMDMQWRILESILGPRVRKIFIRVSLFQNVQHQMRSLAVLNEIMMFVYKTESRRRNIACTLMENDDDDDVAASLGKNGFAKRWYEFDSTMLVQEYVDVVLIPLLRHFEYIPKCSRSSDHTVGMSLCVVSNALRLSSVVLCRESWFDHLILLSMQNLDVGFNTMKDNAHSSISVDAKLDLISLMLITLRGIRRFDRVRWLVMIVDFICTIPSTHSIPKGCISPALKFENGSQRMPSRVGYWSEIALSLILPDIRNEGENTLSNTRPSSSSTLMHTTMKAFLEARPIQSLLSSRSDISAMDGINLILHPSEEFVYTMCSVAYSIADKIIHQIMDPSKRNGSSLETESEFITSDNQLDLHSWLYVALELLDAFLACLLWKPQNKKDMNDCQRETTMCHACQRAYLELLKKVLLTSGILRQSTSIFLNHISPCRIAISSEVPLSNSSHPPVSDVAIENKLTQILNKILTLVTGRGNDIDRCIRIPLLVILCDTWVEQSKRITKSNQLQRSELDGSAGPVDLDNVANIHDPQVLLSLLAMEISQLVDDEEKKHVSKIKIEDEVQSKGYLMACISSVEIIGYTSLLFIKFFSDESALNKENVETCKHILSICTVVLKGQGRVEVESDDAEDIEVERASVSNMDSPPRSPRSRARITAFTAKCTDAAKRLQQFIDDGDDNDQELQGRNINNQILDVLANVGVDNDHYFLGDSLSLINKGRYMTLMQSQDVANFHKRFKGGSFCSGYFVLLYRQLLIQKVSRAIKQTPNCLRDDPEYTREANCMTPKILDPLRLCPFLVDGTIKRENQIEMHNKSYLTNSNKSYTLSSPSDPLAIILSYSKRQWCSRCDGDVEWIFVVTVAVHNVTAVPVLNGIKLSATVTQNTSESDKGSVDFHKAAISANSLYNCTLEPGSHFFWEVVLDSWPLGGEIGITCTLRDLGVECQIHQSLPFSLFNEEGEEEFRQNDDDNDDEDEMNDGNNEENEEILDLIFQGGRAIVPSLCLQPCPLTFYQDNNGDSVTFHFMWLSMLYTRSVTLKDANHCHKHFDSDTKLLAWYSMLKSPEDDGVVLTRKWAFLTWSGYHILVMGSKKGSDVVFNIRGNDEIQLQSYLPRFGFLSSIFTNESSVDIQSTA